MTRRIAFCFSWQARTLDQTYKFFKENLFDTAKEQWFDYDVFCAVEDDSDIEKINLLKPTSVEKIKSSDVEKIIESKYWDFIVNTYPYKYWTLWFTKYCYNSLQQIYKVSKSMALKNNYELNNDIKYDIVLKLRFDAPFPNKLNFKEIFEELQKNNNTVICNKHKYSKLTRRAWADSIDDIYFIMDKASSTLFANMFDERLSCFEGKEITKHVWLHKIFNKILKRNNEIVEEAKKKHKNKKILAYIIVFRLYTVMFFYTKFFMWQDAERRFLSFFQENKFHIIKSQISIRILKETEFFSVKWLFKKSRYEL